MVYVDTNPIRVESEYLYAQSQHRAVVYLGYEPIWYGEWQSQYINLDLESIKYEFTNKYEKFQAEQFKGWLKTNDSSEA